MTTHAPTAETLAERVIKLLGQGIDSSVVAAAVGCDPSYISQLLEDEDVKLQVAVLRAENAEGAVRRDRQWDKIEGMVLDKVEQLLPLVTRPSDLMRMGAMANAAKRRASEYSGNSEKAAPVVNIVLPQSGAVHFQMNVNSQVVEVDGRSTASLPTKKLVERLAERRAARVEQGTVEVSADMPQLEMRAPVSTPIITEKKKVQSILERIGCADEPVPVPKII